jgi:branched-subunit amino acid aminotransferase/4-amino-4-deoxychorismate lyase
MNSLTDSKIFNHAVVNGQCVPIDQAQTSIFNLAFLSSFGVYETVKIDQGQPFHLEAHSRRLLRSAEIIDLNLDVDVDTLAGWVTLLIQLDPQATWSLRLLALGALDAGTSPIIGLRPLPLTTYPDSYYRDGARVILYSGQRAIPNCKSLNTLVNYLAHHAATQAKAVEGLLHHDGYLTEGSRSNLFAVRQGQLITSPVSTILPGITRDVVIEVMKDSDYPVIESPISTELAQYEEFFISSTSMNVIPVTQIDGHQIGDGQVGPMTKLVMARFAAFYRQVMG